MSETLAIANWEAQWILGLLRVEDLPKIAQQALAAGVNSSTLLELAICETNESEQIVKKFQQYLAENERGTMSKQEALRQYAREVSVSILLEQVPAYDGARLIWRATVNAGEKEFHELDAFIYAASEMEDRPKDRDFFVNAIRDEANRWAGAYLSRPHH
jgi:hypothetical protein